MPAAARPLLTARQRRLLLFLVEFVRDHQRPATYREIMRRFRYTSTQAVTCHLTPLLKKGYLTKTPGVSRGVRVADLDAPLREAAAKVLAEVRGMEVAE